MERDLLIRFKSARDAVGLCDDALKAARAEERDAEQTLLDYLDAKQQSATGRYDGVGWASVQKPRLFASILVEKLPIVLVWLRQQGYESAIKETVHASSLSQIVGEQLQNGGEVPEGISYYLKPQVKLYT